MGKWWGRLRVRLLRRRLQQRQRSARGRVATVAMCSLAGLMMTVAGLAARGTDLRSDRNTSLRELVAAQASRNETLRQEVALLRAEVDALGRQQGASPTLQQQLSDASLAAAITPVTGPGIRVVLTDAPVDVKPAGVDDDALVVHQQDIQAVVNALWAGGAEAISIQGQRVIATTGIKCVGNSVVLHGIPYAPPYVIEAIGDADRLASALAASEPLRIYRQYADAYGLGYAQSIEQTLDMPAFAGALGVSHARATR